VERVIPGRPPWCDKLTQAGWDKYVA